MKKIFDYFDYHKYLRELYEEKKARDPNFSYRYIQQKVGIDPGFLLKIFNGQKELSLKYIEHFSQLLKLGKRESRYFELLVKFGRAKKNSDIKYFFEQLLSFVEFSQRKVAADQYEFYQNWHHTAIREAIGLCSFKGDYDQLAQMVTPSIRPLEAKKSIQLLERLKFIKKNSRGVYEVTSRFITTGEEWRALAVRTFQEQVIGLAGEALNRFHKDERDISTVTVTISPDGFEKIRARLSECRKEILKIAHEDVDVNRTFHLNLALFPITKKAPEPIP